MNMQILIVDDEVKIREVLREYLSFNGYGVFEAEDGMEAVEMAKRTAYDLIIMDIMMPRLDGISAVKEIKKFSSAPVLFLSARGEEYDKLFGFEVGADDYVTKPFSLGEITARVKAIIARSKSPVKAKKRDIFGALEIDYDGRTVSVNGKRLELTPKEYELLFYLVKNSGIAVSREQLLDNVWGGNFSGDVRTVDTHIKMLRFNLGDYRDVIVTVRSLGYKFEYEK